MSELLHVCIDRDLSIDQLEEAARRAIAENPENAPSGPTGMGIGPLPPSFMALLTGKKWKSGRTLRVRFLSGDIKIRQNVERFAHQWEQFANIKLEFGDSTEAEIRIAFDSTDGSWSYVGTDCLMIPDPQPTMNYGWLTPTTPDEEYSRVVLHEFGHALGCIHEHQNPEGGIKWNDEQVYDDMAKLPNKWDHQTTFNNILRRYSRNITQFTRLDPASIMMYVFPKEWTKDGFQAPSNHVLSKDDKEFIARMYPKPT